MLAHRSTGPGPRTWLEVVWIAGFGWKGRSEEDEGWVRMDGPPWQTLMREI